MPKPKTRKVCKSCGLEIKKYKNPNAKGFYWLHADGKNYRHIPEPK